MISDALFTRSLLRRRNIMLIYLLPFPSVINLVENTYNANNTVLSSFKYLRCGVVWGEVKHICANCEMTVTMQYSDSNKQKMTSRVCLMYRTNSALNTLRNLAFFYFAITSCGVESQV